MTTVTELTDEELDVDIPERDYANDPPVLRWIIGEMMDRLRDEDPKDAFEGTDAEITALLGRIESVLAYDLEDEDEDEETAEAEDEESEEESETEEIQDADEEDEDED